MVTGWDLPADRGGPGTERPWTDLPDDGSKASWRAWARRQRAATVIDQAGHQAALRRFLASPRRPEGWVVAYRALGDEVSLEPLLDRPELGPFALTRTPERGLTLTLHPAGGRSETHRYGFAQPTADAPVIDDREVAVVLVPGLLFDRSGGRLGRGAGYYDRFLARLGPGVALVGVTGGLVVERLPTDEHDVAMTHLADSRGVRPVGSAAGLRSR